MTPEIRDTLKALAGTEMQRAMLVLIAEEKALVKERLTTAAGEELLKLQGDYRTLHRLEMVISPKARKEHPPDGAYNL